LDFSRHFDGLKSPEKGYKLYYLLATYTILGEFMPEACYAIPVSTFNALQTPTTVLSGQFTLVGAASPLVAVATPVKSVTIENVSTNAVVWVGSAGVTPLTGYGLRPGATVSMDIDDLNKVYVIGTVGQVVSYIAVN
jgi:hypothetical protein